MLEPLPETPPQARIWNAAGENAHGNRGLRFRSRPVWNQSFRGHRQQHGGPVAPESGGGDAALLGHLYPCCMSPSTDQLSGTGRSEARKIQCGITSRKCGHDSRWSSKPPGTPQGYLWRHIPRWLLRSLRMRPHTPVNGSLLYGTGFGPYTPMPLDGFRVPSDATFALADKLVVMFQGLNAAPDLAIAFAGTVGVAVVQVRIPGDLDLSTPPTVMVQAGWSSEQYRCHYR